MRRLIVPLLAGLLAACATMHGPQTITLSTVEIEQQAGAGLERVLAMFEGLDTRRPDVSLMPTSGRLLLEWSLRWADGPAGSSHELAVEVSGRPVLNAAGNGIDLTRVRIEDVRLGGLPRFLGLARLVDRKGMTLPDLPLMTLPPERLRRSGVAYRATGVSVGYTGLKIDIVPM